MNSLKKLLLIIVVFLFGGANLLTAAAEAQKFVPINLMWISKDSNPGQEFVYPTEKTRIKLKEVKFGEYACYLSEGEFEIPHDEKAQQLKDKFLNKVFAWAEENEGGVINVWVDGALLHPGAVDNTRVVIEEWARENPRAASIVLRDIRNIPLVVQNQDVFSPKVAVYFRVDLLRLIIALWMLENKEVDYFVYADIDVNPMSQEQMFDEQTRGYLNKFGIVMGRSGYHGFENSFQIIGNNENLVKAIKMAIVNPAFVRIRKIYSNDLLDRVDGYEQSIYDDYIVMFSYFYSLQGYGRFLVTYYGSGWKEIDIENEQKGEPDNFYFYAALRLGFFGNGSTAGFYEFKPYPKYRKLNYKSDRGSCRLFVPTKKVECPPSRFGGFQFITFPDNYDIEEDEK